MALAQLDTRAEAYIREVLDLPHSLTRLFCREQSLEGGSIAAFLPAALHDEQFYAFTEGGHAPLAVARQAAVLLLTHLLHADPSRLFVLEERFPTRSDVAASNGQSLRWFYGDEVYTIVAHHQNSSLIREAVDELVGMVPAVAVVGYVCNVPPDAPVLQHPPELTDADLAALARGVSHILVSAYDGEGFVLWSRHDVPPPILH